MWMGQYMASDICAQRPFFLLSFSREILKKLFSRVMIEDGTWLNINKWTTWLSANLFMITTLPKSVRFLLRQLNSDPSHPNISSYVINSHWP